MTYLKAIAAAAILLAVCGCYRPTTPATHFRATYLYHRMTYHHELLTYTFLLTCYEPVDDCMSKELKWLNSVKGDSSGTAKLTVEPL